MNHTYVPYYKIYTPIVIGITLVFSIFITRGVYAEYTSSSVEIKELRAKLSTRSTELKALKTLQAALANESNQSEIKKNVARYSHVFNEADVMEMVMLTPPQTKTNMDGSYNLMIKSISLDAGSKLPSGLSLGKVAISIQAKDVTTIVDYITHLTKEAPMAFTIDSISLPIDTSVDEAAAVGGISLNISLGVYYYK